MAKVYSLLPANNGAQVMHACLADNLGDYHMKTVNPWLTTLPFLLEKCSPPSKTQLLHLPVDYAAWGSSTGLPIVSAIHNYVCDTEALSWSSPLHKVHYKTLLRSNFKKGLRAGKVCVAVSHYIADLVKKDLTDVPDIKVIYNGIDEYRFTPSQVKRKKEKFRILFCGNLSRRKRAHLIPLLAESLGQKFEILYTGDHKFTVKSGSSTLMPLGNISTKYMPAIFQSVDALFMPSAREGFGLCVAEAMACGLPVVVTNASAMPELVTVQGGYLCQLDNIEEYSQAFRILYDDEILRREMGEFNRQRVEDLFSMRDMLTAYQLLFEQVLDESHS